MAFREGEQAYIIENNSHVTPVYIVKKDGDFYTIEFSNYARINLRESGLFHTQEEAKEKIRKTPFVRRQVTCNGYTSPYTYNNTRSPYGI